MYKLTYKSLSFDDDNNNLQRMLDQVKNGICNNVCHNRHRRSADLESSLLYQAEDAMKSAKSGLVS
jgi:hypothetical protein